jgi:hypothetical protein
MDGWIDGLLEEMNSNIDIKTAFFG